MRNAITTGKVLLPTIIKRMIINAMVGIALNTVMNGRKNACTDFTREEIIARSVLERNAMIKLYMLREIVALTALEKIGFCIS